MTSNEHQASLQERADRICVFVKQPEVMRSIRKRLRNWSKRRRKTMTEERIAAASRSVDVESEQTGLLREDLGYLDPLPLRHMGLGDTHEPTLDEKIVIVSAICDLFYHCIDPWRTSRATVADWKKGDDPEPLGIGYGKMIDQARHIAPEDLRRIDTYIDDVEKQFGQASESEMTLTDVFKEYDIPKGAISKAAKLPPDDPKHLRSRKLGRNRLIRKNDAKEFATNYLARREQRAVGSKARRS